MKKKTALLFFLLLLLIVACRQKATETTAADEAHLGEVRLEVTGAEEAKPHFKEGLLLLHSFEYADARTAFKKAQELDSDFAMAYWGEAMTYNRSLWRSQDTEDALAALGELAATQTERRAKAGSELERDFLQAVEILFGGEGDKFERDKAYSEHMAKLYKKYPDNHEAAAFYALSLLGSVSVGRDDDIYGQGAKIAQGILQENPNHPGALHYLIHSYDDPVHAHLAKLAADSYSKVAPDAAHALHMPSHIYVALGMWDEVVASNIASYEASVKRMQRMELDNDGRSYHAFAWLLYGYLQQEQYDRARQIMLDMEKYAGEKPSRGARSYMTEMKGSYLVETGRWDDPLAEIEVNLNSLNIVNRAIYAFIDGMKAYQNKDSESLNKIIEGLQEEIRGASQLVSAEGVPMCSSAGSSRNLPNQLDIDQAQVMVFELQALNAWLSGDPKTTDIWFQKATELESNSSYAYGPPIIVYPSYELYGEWLLEQGRAAEAKEQFEKALKKGPKRAKALRGQLAAAKQLKDDQMAAESQAALDEIKQKIRMEDQLSLR